MEYNKEILHKRCEVCNKENEQTLLFGEVCKKRNITRVQGKGLGKKQRSKARRSVLSAEKSLQQARHNGQPAH